jgi:hypothetical protein
MAIGALLYISKEVIAWFMVSASQTTFGYFVRFSPLYCSWLTLGATYLLTQAQRAADPELVSGPVSSVENFFAHRTVNNVRISILTVAIGFDLYNQYAIQIWFSALGPSVLSLGSPFLMWSKVFVIVNTFLWPIAFLSYAVPLSVWARRAAKANLSTKREVDAVSWVALTRRKVRFFRWFMVGCLGWLVALVFISPFTQRMAPSGYMPILFLGLALYAILGFHIIWVPAALIRLSWLFSTEVGKRFVTVASILRFACWSTPVTLAIAGIIPALPSSHFEGALSETVLTPLGLVFQTNYLVLFVASAAAFIAANIAYRKQIKINKQPATQSE